MKYTFLGVLWPLALYSSAEAASAAPDSCDPSAIQACLDRFELRFAECGEGNTYCQCIAVLQKGASCYAACPQEAMTTFIKTYSDGMCATFDPHMSSRSVEDSESRLDIEAARIKSWLGINVLEDTDTLQKPKVRGVEYDSINTGDARRDEDFDSKKEKRSKKKGPKGKVSDASLLSSNSSSVSSTTTTTTSTTSSTTTSSSVSSSSSSHISTTTPLPSITGRTSLASGLSTSGVVKHVSLPNVPNEKALTVTAAEPTTTASLSPQEYQSRLEKERYKANLRSIRSEKRRISSEQEAQRLLANSRFAAATPTSEYEKNVEKNTIATATTSATSTHKDNKQKEHSSGAAKSNAFAIVPTYTLFVLAVAIAVAM